MQRSVGEPRFEVLGRLGRGGTAEVLRVAIPGLSRQAALKRPLPEESASVIDFKKLAARESRLIGGLRFPGLVRLLECPGDEPGYLLLELCEGPTLDRVGKVENLVLALNLLSAVALDLHLLYLRGIVHGDFKPQNVFLPNDWQELTDGKLRYAKLSDFSLGRLYTEPESARAGLGTVGYMAPETIVSGKSGHQADLFALGVAAYQLLTGIHPFMHGESDPVRINANVRELAPEPIEKLRPGLSPALVGLVSSLLAKDEKNRPETALAVCRQLAEAGATYPYDRALPPRYVVDVSRTYAESRQLCPTLSEKQSGWLEVITGADTKLLRIVLACNYSRKSLRLTNNGYEFSHGIYWPAGLRRTKLQSFAKQSYSLKRAAIIRAIGTTSVSLSQSALDYLLLPLLRPRTIRRFSSAPANSAEQAGDYVSATRLYLQAGNLEGADRCAYQAAAGLRNAHRSGAAVMCLNSVLDYARTRDQLSSVRALLMFKGDILKEAGDADDALVAYEEIIGIYRAVRPDKLLAETYKDLGDLYKMKQDAKAGLASLEKALEIFHQLGEELEVSRTYNNIGNSYYYAGDVAQTIRQYRRALRIQRRLDAVVETASTLTNLGSVYCLKGHLRRGTFLLQKSLELKKELGNAGEIARTLNNLGYFLHLSGQSENAVSTLQEALELNRRIGSKNEMLFNLENLTEVQLAAGLLRDSLRYLTDGLALAKEQDDKPHQAHFLRSLVETYVRMGRIGDAEDTLKSLLVLAESIDDPLMSSMVELVTGQIRAEVGDAASAGSHFRAAYEKALAAQLKHQQVQSLLWLIRFANEPDLYETLVGLAKELGMEKERQLAQVNRIEYLLESKCLEEIPGLADGLRETLDTLPDALETARMLRVAADVLLQTGRRDEAHRHLARAYRLAERSSLVSELAKILSLQGQVEGSNGQYEACFAKCRQALQLCKQIADTMRTDTDRALFQGTRSVQFLVGEIRRLGKLLEQKQRAG